MVFNRPESLSQNSVCAFNSKGAFYVLQIDLVTQGFQRPYAEPRRGFFLGGGWCFLFVGCFFLLFQRFYLCIWWKNKSHNTSINAQGEKIMCCRLVDYLSHKQSVFRELHKKYSFHSEKWEHPPVLGSWEQPVYMQARRRRSIKNTLQLS